MMSIKEYLVFISKKEIFKSRKSNLTINPELYRSILLNTQMTPLLIVTLGLYFISQEE